jgi:hypothetical protein
MGVRFMLVAAPTSPRELLDTFLQYTKDGGLDAMLKSIDFSAVPPGSFTTARSAPTLLPWKTFFGPRITAQGPPWGQ